MTSALTRAIAFAPEIPGESDRRVRIRYPVGRRQGISSLTSSPQGAAYVIAADYKLTDHELVVDGEPVGIGRDAITAWVETHLPGLLDHARHVVNDDRAARSG